MAALPKDTSDPNPSSKSLAFSQMSRLQAPSGWLFSNPAVPSQLKYHELMLDKHQNLAFTAVQLNNSQLCWRQQGCKSLPCFCILTLLGQSQCWGLFSIAHLVQVVLLND